MDEWEEKMAGGFARALRYARLADSSCSEHQHPGARAYKQAERRAGRNGTRRTDRGRSPVRASTKTMRRLVSSIHLILKPPFEFSHSEKAEWMSRVLSSFGKPVKERMRVTDAESWEMEVDIVAGVGW